MPDNRTLIRLAGELADGRPVAWEHQLADRPELADELASLRLVERITRGFAAAPGDGGAAGAPASSEDLGKQAAAALADRYAFVRVLGVGGMATVFLVEDLKHRRPLAIKILQPEIANAIGTERFLREIEIAARLNHPHILPLFDSGSADGLLYYVMPFAEGESLRELLAREGRLTLADALRITCEVADALHYAHARQVVHRDIKPGNIVLQEGHAIVADFGIAAAIVAAGGPQRTATGWIVGTPGYMSPEQALGLARVDARSDIFSLGCVLYETLTGTTPFPRARDLALPATRRLRPQLDLPRLRPDVPASVSRAVGRALAVERDSRFETAAAFAAALIPPVRQDTPAPKPSRTTETPNNLPPELTGLVGRARETAECLDHLSQVRMLTLCGAGGSGKTRLALRIAEDMLGETPDGVWFADLSPLTDGDRVAGVVAAAVGLRETADTPIVESLAAWLGDRRITLVLDNVEHVLRAAAELAGALLARCPRLKLLVTSREPTGLPAELVYPVPTLSLPDPRGAIDLPSAVASDACRLFADRAAFARPGFALNAASAGAVVDICRELDGLPLAIELAAARLRVLGTEEIRVRLRDRFRLLTGAGGPPSSARHRTLREMMDWSYEHLDLDEQSLFQNLSVFAGGWSLEAVAAVVTPARDEFETLDLLARLVDKSLVQVESAADGRSRYRYLETVRQYALERLEKDGVAGEARDRHLDFFIRVAEWGEAKVQEGQDGAALATLQSDNENLLSALVWSDTGATDPTKMLRLAGALGRYWYIRGEYALGRRALATALAKNHAASDPGTLAKAEYAAAAMALFQGDAAAARPHLERYLAVCEGMADRNGVAIARNGLGLAATRMGEYEVARREFEAALELCRAANDRNGTSRSFHNLGVVELSRDNDAGAQVYFDQAVCEAGTSGLEHSRALSLAFHALVLARLDRAEEARAQLVQGLRLVQALGARRLGAHALEAAAQLAARTAPSLGARMLGMAVALREAIASPLWPAEQALLDRFALDLRARLAPAAFEQAFAAGSKVPFEAAIAEAMSWLEADGGA